MRYYLCDFVVRAFLRATGHDPNFLTSPPASDDEDGATIGATTAVQSVETDAYRRSRGGPSTARGETVGPSNTLLTRSIHTRSQTFSLEEAPGVAEELSTTEEGKSLLSRTTEAEFESKKINLASLTESKHSSKKPGDTTLTNQNDSGVDANDNALSTPAPHGQPSSSSQTAIDSTHSLSAEDILSPTLSSQRALHILPVQSDMDSHDISLKCPPNSPQRDNPTRVRNLPFESLLTPAKKKPASPSVQGDITKEAGPGKPTGHKCRRGRRGGRARGRASSTTPSTVQSPSLEKPAKPSTPPEPPAKPSAPPEPPAKPPISKTKSQSKRIAKKQQKSQMPQQEKKTESQIQAEQEEEYEQKIHINDNLIGWEEQTWDQEWEQQPEIQENPQIKDCEENQTYVPSGNDSPEESFPQEQKWSSDESWSSKPTGNTKDLKSEQMETSGGNEESSGLNESIQPKTLVEESEPVTKSKDMQNTELKQQSDTTEHSESSSTRRLRLNPNAPEFKPVFLPSSADNISISLAQNPSNSAVAVSTSASDSGTAFLQTPSIVPDASFNTREIVVPSYAGTVTQRGIGQPYETQPEVGASPWSHEGDMSSRNVLAGPLMDAYGAQAHLSHLPRTAIAHATPHLDPYAAAFRADRYAINDSVPLTWVQPSGPMFPPTEPLPPQRRIPKPLAILPATSQSDASAGSTHPSNRPTVIKSLSPIGGATSSIEYQSNKSALPKEHMRLFDGAQNKLSVAYLAPGASAGESSSQQRVLIGNSAATIEAVPNNGPSILTPEKSCAMSPARSGPSNVPPILPLPAPLTFTGSSTSTHVRDRYRPPIPQESGWEQLFGDTSSRRYPHNGNRPMAFYGDEV